jgi:hypothetical protein
MSSYSMESLSACTRIARLQFQFAAFEETVATTQWVRQSGTGGVKTALK